ncbi:MAG: ATP-dependent DNA helicase RecG [Candidatus Yanofskybacteria bacterium]|nr:ATP-dependent DNA helicase RecG [Candidatus Yanofskybacteria bacterium]
MNLTTPIEKLARVGPRFSTRLKKLGIKTVRDLLWHFPARYEDYSKLSLISDVNSVGQMVSIAGKIADIELTRSWRRHMTIINATIKDKSGLIHAVWFNQPYITDALKVGTFVSLSGKTSLDKNGLYLSSPSYEKIDSSTHNLKPITYNLVHTGRLVPIYPETEGLTSKYMRFLIKPLLAQISAQGGSASGGKSISDPLPLELLTKYNFPALAYALQAIHFPENLKQAAAAKQRFAFEEILLFQLRVLRDHRQLQSLKAPQIKFNKELVASFVKKLPFELTNDQRIAAYEILQDLERPFPMNRLLNGDVGSGKTVVALIAAYQTINAGLQAVFMAPTEILARQHFQTITEMLASQSPIKIGLLIGGEAKQWPNDETETEKIPKKLMYKKIAAGEINLLIGTHAVIQKDVIFKNLGLVVIDEQHRFGVEQRMKLVKNSNLSPITYHLSPHLLSMTATPIPRTLALTIYGDLDISLIKEKPKGRQQIITKIIPRNKRDGAHKFIEQQIKNGRQVFVICPRIEMSKTDGFARAKPISQAKLVWAEVKAVTEEYEKLSKNVFPQYRVAMLHGRLKSKVKDEIMKKFKDGHYDILVSTSVVEVGVDIHNATIMMIESAERFGLAQLHQFRGRVGRGPHQSYCFLFTSPVRNHPAEGTATTASGRPTSNGTSSSDTPVGRHLRALELTDDGFQLAEMDLKIRGPGEFTGTQQSGIPDIAMASLSDLDLIKKARLEARLLLKDDPALKHYPLLAIRLAEIQRLVHFE